jgi:hypothetical protein
MRDRFRALIQFSLNLKYLTQRIETLRCGAWTVVCVSPRLLCTTAQDDVDGSIRIHRNNDTFREIESSYLLICGFSDVGSKTLTHQVTFAQRTTEAPAAAGKYRADLPNARQ